VPQTLAPSPAETRDRIFVKSLAWIASARWVSQLLRWVATLAMAKLLLPEDYGIVGMAAVVIGLVNQVAEFGLGSAVVQHRELSRHTEQRIAGVAVVIAFALACATSALSPAVAAFYTQDALWLVLPALSLRFLIDAFATVPRALLARNLQFKQLALAEAIESTVMAATGLVVAFLTHSYWALIAANLVSGVAFAAVANVYAPIAPRWPGRLSELRPLLTFGRDLVLSRLAWFTYSNADFVVVGRFLGEASLGIYTLTWSIASAPAEKFAGLVLSVAPAILSDARREAGEVRRIFLMMVQGVALVIFPLAVGLAMVAELVVGLLGPQWAAAALPLRLLALAFIFRALATLEPVVLLARHETYVDRNMMALFAVAAPVAFIIGAQWGTIGVAAAWLLFMPVVSLPLQERLVWRKIGVSWGDWLRAVWPGASSAAFMALVVHVVLTIRPVANAVGLLSVLVGTGGAVYLAFLWTIHPAAAQALIRTVRRRPSRVSATEVALGADPA
jgi:PST family polysaccharide transporter